MPVLLDAVYLLGGAVVAPFWAARAAVSARHRAGIRQRLGNVPALAAGRPRLWLHTASVGEAGIVRTLVPAFASAHPDWDVAFSTNTNTGLENLAKLYPDRARFYFPLDFSPCVRRCVARVRPAAVGLVELELWPNFMQEMNRRGVPVVILNGRISERSARGYRRLRRLAPDLWSAVAVCCARSEEDAEQFAAAGLDPGRVVVTGSMKYDTLPKGPDEARVAALRGLLGIAADAPVLVGGSTWAGEEKALIDCFSEVRKGRPDLRLVLVPRHTERGAEVAKIVADAGLRPLRKSQLAAGGPPAAGACDEVPIVDTVGDLVDCYATASVVFVGRSLTPPGGGQNMLEPCALGRPTLVGPYTGNFRPEMAYLTRRRAVRVVADAADLRRVVAHFLDAADEADALGRRGRETVLENVGATGRTLEAIERVLARRG